jgi:hypothetical protein
MPVPLVGYYVPGKDGQPEPVLSLASLRKLLDSDSPPRFSTDQMMRGRFREAVEQYQSQDSLVAEQNQKAHVASLKEAIRQLLLQAAYIELAQTANRGFFDEVEDLPLDFSDQAIRRLKGHKIPFAGALKLVDVSDMQPRPDVPKYINLRDRYPDILTRRFESIKTRLGDILAQLVQARQIMSPTCRDTRSEGGFVISFFRQYNSYI